MTVSKEFNIYCDESCHLENDNIPVMALGAVSCERRYVRELSNSVRRIKAKFGLSSDFEIKWTKVSPAKERFYLEVIELFLTDNRLRFRGLVVPDKEKIDYSQFNQSHDDWYYEMYFRMLRYIFNPSDRYCVYLDVKDTMGGSKTRNLHGVLSNSLFDYNQQCIERVQQIRSHESELLQITDLLIGTLTYANRMQTCNSAKLAIVKKISEEFGNNVLTSTTMFSYIKFNLLVWHADKLL